MTKPFLLLGWQLSYFTGKTRSHLRYKGIPYVERPITLREYAREAPRRTGAAVMPIVVTPEGDWLQDTSVIIDVLEDRFPEPAIRPAGALQQVLDLLLEAWADEWWIPMAMHTRWNYPHENWELFRREAGSALLPWAPRFLQDFAARRARSAMCAYLEGVGIIPAQYSQIEDWARFMLGLLDRHFAAQDFLLGARPCRADFALVGTFYGHLARDPWPRDHLVAPYRALRAWLERMDFATRPTGEFLAEDAVAPTLLPVLESVFKEFLGWCSGTARVMNATMPPPAPGHRWPRGMDTVEFPMGGKPFRRAAFPYVLWMLQRVRQQFRSLPAPEQSRVHGWLAARGGATALELDFPPLERQGLRVAMAAAT
jgi:glutathione S-transferase